MFNMIFLSLAFYWTLMFQVDLTLPDEPVRCGQHSKKKKHGNMLFIQVLGHNCDCSNDCTHPDSERNIVGSWTTPFISSTCTGVAILAFLSRNRYSLNESSNYAVSGKYSALHNTQHFISRRLLTVKVSCHTKLERKTVRINFCKILSTVSLQ
jgi:hypothetical protein